VVNAGGVVSPAPAATPGIGPDELDQRIAGIGDVVAAVLRDADAAGITTLDAAERIAEARLAAAR
jgi:leucine dehydrogenase